MCVSSCVKINKIGVEVYMATNLAIDDKLLKQAQEIGGKSTKKSTVTEALEEYISRRKRLKALKSLGTFEMIEDFNYKKDRKQR